MKLSSLILGACKEALSQRGVWVDRGTNETTESVHSFTENLQNSHYYRHSKKKKGAKKPKVIKVTEEDPFEEVKFLQVPDLNNDSLLLTFQNQHIRQTGTKSSQPVSRQALYDSKYDVKQSVQGSNNLSKQMSKSTESFRNVQQIKGV